MLASIIQDTAITILLPALARINEPVNGERLHNTAYGALEHGIPENRYQESRRHKLRQSQAENEIMRRPEQSLRHRQVCPCRPLVRRRFVGIT